MTHFSPDNASKYESLSGAALAVSALQPGTFHRIFDEAIKTEAIQRAHDIEVGAMWAIELGQAEVKAGAILVNQIIGILEAKEMSAIDVARAEQYMLHAETREHAMEELIARLAYDQNWNQAYAAQWREDQSKVSRNLEIAICMGELKLENLNKVLRSDSNIPNPKEPSEEQVRNAEITARLTSRIEYLMNIWVQCLETGEILRRMGNISRSKAD